MTTGARTAKGEATRARIVEATADRILAAGLGGTSLDDVRADTATSKSQLFHYFPGGKAELVRAVVDLQGRRVLDAQRPALDALDDWPSWEDWRSRLLAHYDAQHGWGCPIGSLATEAAATDPVLAGELTAYLRDWAALLAAGVGRLRAAGHLRAEADPERLGVAVLAAVEGGLLLTRTEQGLWPLEAALDGALAHLRSWAPAER
ncbi:TetR/AcrR family transcriptional regulator [Patulibacter minatonensis]|uniref:TetR/AcrR family transcriptional regulator n=1 Tax=Patulibacter minatonensis TaxID=298163 RepID=UPI000479C3A0|nr:TetR family transcriptional regulator C-terminal domain-containing protein [Patulibacter minatonensis]